MDGLIHDGGLEIHTEGHAPGLEGHEAHHRVNELFEYLLRRFRRDLLDVHAAFFRPHHHHFRRLAVDDETQIVFLLDVRPFLDEEAVHLLALRAGLMRDQDLP